MRQEKKKYLNSYLLQEAVIERLCEMCVCFPERKEKYNSEINKAKQKRLEIENKITAIEDTLLRELLFQKYVFGKTLEEISLILNYSKRHIERLHIKALDEFKM